MTKLERLLTRLNEANKAEGVAWDMYRDHPCPLSLSMANTATKARQKAYLAYHAARGKD